MYNRSIVRVAILTGFVSIVAALPLSAGDADSWTAPRTPDGKPDLQGVWANNNATPLERPEQLADKSTLSDAELAEFKERAAKLFNDEAGDAAFGDSVFHAALSDTKNHTSTDGQTGNYNWFWLAQREFSDNRTSLVIDPPDGRIPELTPEGQAKTAELKANRRRPPRGPEDRHLGERCITFGVPRLGAGYNSYYQILQTPDTVAVMMEMIHDTRIIPLDGRPHVDDRIRQWHGTRAVVGRATRLSSRPAISRPRARFEDPRKTCGWWSASRAFHRRNLACGRPTACSTRCQAAGWMGVPGPCGPAYY